jgi:predicted TIM-barrel fold metal-dependent hydrolase
MTGMNAEQLRTRLDHPVIDTDGHWLEAQPVFRDYLREVGGADMLARYERISGKAWYRMSAAERFANRSPRSGWWQFSTSAADRAASMLPSVMRSRLDEWGIDVSLVYPSLPLALLRVRDDAELRGALARAYNMMTADLFRGLGDRLIPAGVCPMNTPAEAIEEAEYAVRELGFKLLMMNCTVPRPMEVDAEWQPDPQKRRFYVDCLAMDSPYDYDPVWRKFCDLKVAVTNHIGSQGVWPNRVSPTSFVADHLGHFAESHHYFARGLFLGGVTQRFPNLNFAFLEGGVGWACNLYADLLGHWKKRNRTFMERHFRPASLNTAALAELLAIHTRSQPRYARYVEEIVRNGLDCFDPGVSQGEAERRDAGSDDFCGVKITNEKDIERLFTRTLFFGCEADDPMIALAFEPKFGTPLKPVLGSDISHFDVVDPSDVLPEAWELVEHGLLDEDQFRQFVFDNAVELHGGMNPDFYKGTVVEQAAKLPVSN